MKKEKKKSIKILLPVFSVATILYGCSGYLDKVPLDKPSDATFLTNETELSMAVTGCYNELWLDPTGESVPFPLLLDCLTDLEWDRNGGQLTMLGKGLATNDNSIPSLFWSELYKGIGRCNFIFSKVNQLQPVVPADKLAVYLAETRFLRAYYYSYLNELYNGVPLITTPLTLEQSQTPRSSKEAVTDFILAELDSAAVYLPDKATPGRVTKGAALAIASRVALYNGRWQVAADRAKKIMDQKIYSLHPDFGALFTYAGKNSGEIIFTIQYLKGKKAQKIPWLFFSRMAMGSSNKIPVESLVDSYECTDGLSIDQSPLYDPAHPFNNRDPRLNYTVVLPQTNFMGYIFETHKDSTTTWNYNTTPPSRIANTDATNAYASFSGFIWRKYTDPADKADVNNSDLPFILARYAEVLLNYAEAKTELNQQDNTVYDAINAIRGRAGVNMPLIASGKTQTELRAVIRRERKYELAAEGLRLFDIRRWKLAEQVMNGPLYGRIPKGYLSNAPVIDEFATPHYDNVSNKSQMRVIETRQFRKDRDYVWPIPRLELETNKALVQNPNY